MNYGIEDFTNYIHSHKWKNAKTFENFAPHEYIFSFPCNVVANLDEVWLNGSLEIRQRLQRLIFPKGLTYDLSNFRTAEISSLFKIIGTLSVPSYNMVPPSEFESLSTP